MKYSSFLEKTIDQFIACFDHSLVFYTDNSIDGHFAPEGGQQPGFLSEPMRGVLHDSILEASIENSRDLPHQMPNDNYRTRFRKGQ
jgi:hypothetical protein